MSFIPHEWYTLWHHLKHGGEYLWPYCPVPNSNANAMPDSNADACVEMNKHAVAKYTIQMPNTNAMLYANAVRGTRKFQHSDSVTLRLM